MIENATAIPKQVVIMNELQAGNCNMAHVVDCSVDGSLSTTSIWNDISVLSNPFE